MYVAVLTNANSASESVRRFVAPENENAKERTKRPELCIMCIISIQPGEIAPPPVPVPQEARSSCAEIYADLVPAPAPTASPD